jgi:hypothetical protein
MLLSGVYGRVSAGVLLGFVSVMAACARGDEPPFPLVPARECNPRAGLPNFIALARTPGVKIRVAYLGGSITAQSGWRPKTLDFFRKTYPNAEFFEINAAIGGTGSDLGVFRLEQDVLDFKPDLLFVEFATNDSGAPPAQIQKCVEGIVRQTWKTLPKCDICFVYTVVEWQAGPLHEGKFPRAPSVMEAIAEHYGIPSIHLGMEVARLAKAGKLVWAAPLPKNETEKQALGDKFVFAPDSVHPYPETGHKLYLQAIVRSWNPIAEASRGARPHILGKPLVASNYEHARLVPISAEMLSKGFVPIDLKNDQELKYFAARLKSLYRGTHPGDAVTFRFKGTSAAIYDVIGPGSSQVIVTVDDQPPRVVPRFDSFCLYHRLAVVPIATDLPDTVHHVKVEIHPAEPDRMKMLGGQTKNLDRPERFRGTHFYPSAILIVGEPLN